MKKRGKTLGLTALCGGGISMAAALEML